MKKTSSMSIISENTNMIVPSIRQMSYSSVGIKLPCCIKGD